MEERLPNGDDKFNKIDLQKHNFCNKKDLRNIFISSLNGKINTDPEYI